MPIIELDPDQWAILIKYNEVFFGLFSIISALATAFSLDMIFITENVLLAGLFGTILRYSKFSYTESVNNSK